MAASKKKPSKKTVRPGKDISEAMAEDLQKKILGILKQDVKNLVIDLKGVERIDPVGIGIFVAAHNSLNQSDGKMNIINASDNINNLFQMMGLDRHLEVNAA